MSRSENIHTIPDKFKALTIVKRGHMNTRLPHHFADKNKQLAAAVSKRKAEQ